MSDTSRRLLDDFRSGSADAADAIFHRYVLRLTALARVRLSEKISRRIDPEDVVLSAYRSFFVAAREGRFELLSPGDLWRLLVSIVLHKLHRQVAAQKALKRSVAKEVAPLSFEQIASREPTAEDVLTASDELEVVLKQLSPLERTVAELRLQGETIAAIAGEISRNERTVRRLLKEIRQVFEHRLQLHEGTELFIGRSVGTPHEQSMAISKPAPRRSCSIPIQVPFPHDLMRLSYGDYVLKKFIGSGGSGKVYRALARATGRDVAIKFLRKSFHSRLDVVQRFVDEAALVARINHIGIAKVHGLGQSPQGSYFIVSDWYPDGDLSQRMRAGPIETATAANWVRQAALAIQYVHEQGLVHCDLKPSNLLIDHQGNVVVTDFGLARSMSHDGSHSIEGTAGYMALEQALPGSSPLGPWTDVFGLGAVLYAILAGHPPYNGNRPSEILAKLLANHPIEPLSSQRTDVAISLEQLCLQCLNREPQDRPGTAGELAERLHAIINKQ